MANYTDLINAIKAVIKQNGNNEITGQILQNALSSMVNAMGKNKVFVNVASPSTNPGSEDGNVFYLAATAGTYVNFSNIIVTDQCKLLFNTSSGWSGIDAGIPTLKSVNDLGTKTVQLEQKASIAQSVVFLDSEANRNLISGLEPARTVINPETGELVPNGGISGEWTVSKPIYVHGAREVYYNGFGTASIGNPTHIYAEDGSYLGRVGTADTSGKSTIKLPQGAYSIRLTCKIYQFMANATLSVVNYMNVYTPYYSVKSIDLEHSIAKVATAVSQSGIKLDKIRNLLSGNEGDKSGFDRLGNVVQNITSATWSATTKIPVAFNKKLYVNTFGKCAVTDFVYCYTANDSLLTTIRIALSRDKFEVDLPEGVDHVRLLIGEKINPEQYCAVSTGGYMDTYESANYERIDLSSINDLQHEVDIIHDMHASAYGYNLIHGLEPAKTGINPETGELVPNGGISGEWTVTKPILVYGAREVYYNGFGTALIGTYESSKARGMIGNPTHIYAKDGSYLGRVGTADTSGKSIIKLPQGAYSIRLSCKIDQFIETATLSVGSYMEAYEPYVEVDNKVFKETSSSKFASLDNKFNNIGVYIPERRNLISGLEPDRTGINPETGELIPNGGTVGGWTVSKPILVYGAREVYYNGFGVATIGNPTHIYAKDGSYLGRVGTADTSGKSIIKLPQGAYSIRLTCRIYQFIETATLSVGSYMEAYEPYYDDLKIYDINNMTSPDGTIYTKTVDDCGDMVMVPQQHAFLGQSFPFNINGIANSKTDIMAVLGANLYQMNRRGLVKKHKTAIGNTGFSFRKYTNNEIRYTVARTTSDTPISINGGYYPTELVIYDENFCIIKYCRLLAAGNIPNNYPAENHDYIYFNDNHYILMTYKDTVVSNIPGKEGSYRACNCAIQEIKNDAVVFHWESVNHPELYAYGVFNASWDNFNVNNQANTVWNDYAHMNSMVIDKRDGNILASFRHIGLMKINRTTGEILWILGRNKLGITGVTREMCGYLQHDAVYNYDNSITIFDNSGCVTNNTRICRYWIDEKTKTLTKFKEYICAPKKSPYMGSASLVEDNEIYSTFIVNYGGDTSLANECVFEEVTFYNSGKITNLKALFKTPQGGMYRTFCPDALTQK